MAPGKESRTHGLKFLERTLNNKTGQVELFARQGNYYYFKNTLMGAACPFIGKAGV